MGEEVKKPNVGAAIVITSIVLAFMLAVSAGVQVWRELREPERVVSHVDVTEDLNYLATSQRECMLKIRKTEQSLSDRIELLRDRVDAIEAKGKPRPGSLPGKIGDAPK